MPGTVIALYYGMKTFKKLAVFNRPAPLRLVICELDSVLESVWDWEVTNHGLPSQKYQGRAVYEAVIELQEWLITEDK